jgi:hypothetical protein
MTPIRSIDKEDQGQGQVSEHLDPIPRDATVKPAEHHRPHDEAGNDKNDGARRCGTFHPPCNQAVTEDK